MKTKRILVGVLTCIGTATGLGAACPPEGECTSVQVVPMHGVVNGTFDVQGLVNHFVQAHADGCDGEKFQVAFQLDENFQPLVSFEGLENFKFGLDDLQNIQSVDLRFDDLRSHFVNFAQNLDGNSFPALARLAAFAQPEGKTKTRIVSRSKDDDGSTSGKFVIVEDDNAFSLTLKDGKVTSLERNGKKVSLDNVKKDGEHVKILDDDGKVVYEFELGDSGAIVVSGGDSPQWRTWSGADPSEVNVAFQPEPPKAMIGVQLGEPDGMLLGHFGLEAGEATLITGVYEGLPAGKAGLKPYDLIIAVNGKKPAGQGEVREVLRGKDDGDKVELTILHKGERKDIKVTLVKYDQEALENSKLDAVQMNSFFVTQGGPGDVMVAPGIGALRGFGTMDTEKARELAETMRKQAEEYARKFKDDPNFRDAYRLRLENVPDAPRPPAQGGAAQWERLEERLERLERMIEKLAEQRSKAGTKAGG